MHYKKNISVPCCKDDENSVKTVKKIGGGI